MKKTLLKTLIFLIFFCHSINTKSQCLLDLSDYDLVFYDDFNTYNISSEIYTGTGAKWSPEHSWGNAELDGNGYCDSGNQTNCWLKDNISLITDPTDQNDKCVALNFKYYPDPLRSVTSFHDKIVTNGVFYKTGSLIRARYDESIDPCIDTNVKGFKYGVFEVKCKVPMTSGKQSAIWLWNGYWSPCRESDPPPIIPPNTPGWEIDVFETLNNNGNRSYASCIQPNPDNNFQSQLVHHNWTETDPSDDFHIYTLAWTPEKVTWFVDGKEIRSSDNTQGIPRLEMDFIISNHFVWDCKSNNHTSCDPDNPSIDYCEDPSDPFIIDYVKIYKHRDPITQWPTFKTTEGHSLHNLEENIGSTNTKIYSSSVNTQERIYYVIPTNSTTGTVYYKEEQANGSWITTQTIANNVALNSNICVENGSGKVYYKGTDNEIWDLHFWQGSWVISSLDMSNLYSNDVDNNLCLNESLGRIYYRTNANRLCYFQWDNQTSPNWVKVQTSNYNFLSSPVISTDQQKLFYIGTDNEVWNHHLWQGNWISSSLDGNQVYPNDVASSLCTDLNGKLFYISNTNEIKYFEWITNSNPNWVKTTTTHYANSNSLLDSKRANQLFYTNSNHISNIYGGSPWSYSKLNLITNEYATPNLSASNNLPRVYFINTNNDLNYFEWGACEIINPISTTENIFYRPANITNEGTIKMSLLISPNPTDRYIYISNIISESTETVNIYDAVGRFIDTMKIENKNQLDLINLQSGIYLIQINSQVFRIIKL